MMDDPTPSTSAGLTNHVILDPANLRQIPGHIEIDGLTMAEYFMENMQANLTIRTKIGKIAATWVPDAQGPETTDPAKEPETADPAPVPNAQNNDMEDIIQILDDHIAVSPNPAQQELSEKGTDSGLEENLTYEREESETENESENQGIEVVGPSGTDNSDDS